MENAQIIELGDEQDVICPICRTTIIDNERVQEQPSCGHVKFIYCDGETFEFIRPELEAQLAEEEAKADDEDELFDVWKALLGHLQPGDSILKQTDQSMACGPVPFIVWVGI